MGIYDESKKIYETDDDDETSDIEDLVEICEWFQRSE